MSLRAEPLHKTWAKYEVYEDNNEPPDGCFEEDGILSEKKIAVDSLKRVYYSTSAWFIISSGGQDCASGKWRSLSSTTRRMSKLNFFRKLESKDRTTTEIHVWLYVWHWNQLPYRTCRVDYSGLPYTVSTVPTRFKKPLRSVFPNHTIVIVSCKELYGTALYCTFFKLEKRLYHCFDPVRSTREPVGTKSFSLSHLPWAQSCGHHHHHC